MTTITGFTSTRMLGIENNSVVSGTITGDDLILTRHGGGTINAGDVRGPVGPQGPVGEVTQAALDAELADIEDRLFFPGDVKFSAAAMPSGWLAFGQTIANASTLYPELYAAVPIDWTAGTSLVLPSMIDALLASHGNDTDNQTGKITGLTDDQNYDNSLQEHRHAAPHDHVVYGHGHDANPGANANYTELGGSHSHTGTTLQDSHTHTANSGLAVVYQSGGGNLGLADGNVWGGVYGAPLNVGVLNVSTHVHDHYFTTSTSQTHRHQVTVSNVADTATSPSSENYTGFVGESNLALRLFSVKNRRLHLNLYIKT